MRERLIDLIYAPIWFGMMTLFTLYLWVKYKGRVDVFGETYWENFVDLPGYGQVQPWFYVRNINDGV